MEYKIPPNSIQDLMTYNICQLWPFKKQAQHLCIAAYIKLWHVVFKQRGQKVVNGVEQGRTGSCVVKWVQMQSN